ncbi:hypothetical protein EYF80_035530 [Liparis tanakae]|uniref:Uncharacterized protein n=1 Tax=Liparis tanakae TaxID=230148 RepID=A0A4Z2GLX6_9TELE|nr:hypothetical protein EYF80_035530 [Liparis tanakae]
MTRKGEKRVSSTPAQNQSEVEEWTGQSPSAESWLVSQQQGSIIGICLHSAQRWKNFVCILQDDVLMDLFCHLLIANLSTTLQSNGDSQLPSCAHDHPPLCSVYSADE